MRLEFTKMHGLGNDFVVVNAITQNVMLRPEQIRRLADRHTGVGFDQLLIVEPPTRPDVEFSYRIFNADGNEVEHCGNGARCFALFVTEQKLTRSNPISVSTCNGVLSLNIDDNRLVTVDMGAPKTAPADIPFAPHGDGQHSGLYRLDIGGQAVELSVVNVGNPHAVVRVDNCDQAPVATLGPQIQQSGAFAEGVNVGFLEILSPTEAKLRVFERGVGETQACGTGACAAMVAAVSHGWLEPTATLRLLGGALQLSYQAGEPILMTGPGEFVFDGTARL